ncbi:hypothetical protein D1823_12885 [Ruegeria sp. AD91A]|nr:hypothetical protein D1823_12885 [Ruegeria sp. AD91A]
MRILRTVFYVCEELPLPSGSDGHARHLIAASRDDYNQYRPHSSLSGLTPREYANRSAVGQNPNRANQSTRPLWGAGHFSRIFRGT